MSPAQTEAQLVAAGCAIVADGGDFALVYPAGGYRPIKRAHTLLARTRAGAVLEAFEWLVGRRREEEA